MSNKLGGWIHSFTVTETVTHKKGYTIYKITSIIFPRSVPEALTCVTVWKRFREVKRLYKELCKRHKALQLRGTVPELKDNGFFKRFEPAVIQQRKDYILALLDFAAQHPALYKSYAFVNFLENGHTPNTSPTHKSNIETICDKLDLPFDPEIQLIDPSKDNVEGSPNMLRREDSVSRDREDEDVSLDSISNLPPGSIESRSVESDEDTVSQISVCRQSIFEFNDDCDYIYEAAYEFSKAVQAEVNQEYKEAFEKYKLGIDKLLTGSKCDNNEDRKSIAKAKVAKYMARAEEICDKIVEDEVEQKFPTLKLAIDDENSKREVVLERPWNQLSKYKVMKTFEKVMQVQDVTEKKIYIMKGIQKPSTRTNSQSIFLPQNVAYMVELIAFFQSDTSIYLLLRPAKGGRLFDYIQSYTPTNASRTSLNEIFTEPCVAHLNDEEETNTPQEDDEPDTNCANLNKDQNDEPQAENELSASPRNSDEENISPSPPKSDGENISPSPPKSDGENIPSFELLSEDMDVNDLVNCSEMLLKSVSETLEQFKEMKNIPKESSVSDDEASQEDEENNSTKSDDKTDLEQQNLDVGTLQNFVSPSKCKKDIRFNKRRCIPEFCIKRWITELFTAIESLHMKGVILGDLRPSNILLGSEGQLILSYFYKCESADERSQFTLNDESVEGLYVAPERPLTFESDWWSFGVIAFEMLTGFSYKCCHPAGYYSYYEVLYPEIDLTEVAKSFLNGLLQYLPENRLSADEIKCHAFFDDTDWEDVINKGMKGS